MYENVAGLCVSRKQWSNVPVDYSQTCLNSYLSENVFATAIKGEALLIKSHVVSSTVDGAGSITLVGSALPLHVFTSAVIGYTLYQAYKVHVF